MDGKWNEKQFMAYHSTYYLLYKKIKLQEKNISDISRFLTYKKKTETKSTRWTESRNCRKKDIVK